MAQTAQTDVAVLGEFKVEQNINFREAVEFPPFPFFLTFPLYSFFSLPPPRNYKKLAFMAGILPAVTL